ncbi:MAG: lysozyme inhibitor LprI family protein [Dongiaceae bacterium]
MRLLRAGLIAIAAGLACPALAQEDAPQPSFDCVTATQPVEALICADPTLADLDQVMADRYSAALGTRPGEAQATLRTEQRVWAGNRSIACAVETEAAIEVEDAIGCLIALYRARIAELQPGDSNGGTAVSPSGYGWLMGDWTVAAIRKLPADAARAVAARAALGRTLHFAEAPIATLGGAACSFPRYRAEPSAGPEFGDLSDYPAAVMVRVACVGIALLDVVRLTDEKILLGEGEVVFELERRR